MDCFWKLCFMLVCVVMSFLLFVALWSPVGKGLTPWLLFCHFPKYILVHIRIKGEVGALKLV